MELWDLYDKERRPLGKTHERGKPIAKSLSKSIADTVFPSGSPGSCGGWTPAANIF